MKQPSQTRHLVAALSAYLACVFAATSLSAATIICTNAVDALGTSAGFTRINFTPTFTTPQPYGDQSVFPKAVGVDVDTNGGFSANILAGGVYTMTTVPPFNLVSSKIVVPVNDSNTYTLNQALTLATNRVFNFTNSSLYAAGSGVSFTTNGAVISINASGSTTNLDYLDFKVSSTNSPAFREGREYYDYSTHSLAYLTDRTNVTVNSGQEVLKRVKNMTGATITNGAAVTLVASSGTPPRIALAQSTTNSASIGYDCIGLATEDIAQGSEGFVCVLGTVHGIYTDNWIEGSTVYVSTNAGAITTNPPPANYASIIVGAVDRGNNNNGDIFVSPQQAVHISLGQLPNGVVTNTVNIDIYPDGSYYYSGKWYKPANSTTCGFQEAWDGVTKQTKLGVTNFSGISFNLTAGMYYFATPLVFSNNYTFGLKMQGVSSAATRMAYAGTNRGISTIQIVGGKSLYNVGSAHVELRDILFTATNNTTNVLVAITNQSRFYAKDCAFFSWQSMDNTDVNGGNLSIAAAVNLGAPGLVGLQLDSSGDIVNSVDNCQFFHLADGVVAKVDHFRSFECSGGSIGYGLTATNLWPLSDRRSLGAIFLMHGDSVVKSMIFKNTHIYVCNIGQAFVDGAAGTYCASIENNINDIVSVSTVASDSADSRLAVRASMIGVNIPIAGGDNVVKINGPSSDFTNQVNYQVTRSINPSGAVQLFNPDFSNVPVEDGTVWAIYTGTNYFAGMRGDGAWYCNGYGTTNVRASTLSGTIATAQLASSNIVNTAITNIYPTNAIGIVRSGSQFAISTNYDANGAALAATNGLPTRVWTLGSLSQSNYFPTELYYVTSTNIFGTTNITGGVFTNNAMTMILTTGVWRVSGFLQYHNTGSGGINCEPAFPAGATPLGGWNARLQGEVGSITPFYRRWPQDTDWYQAFNTGTDIGAGAQFEGIVSVTGTVIFGPIIKANTLVPTNPPYISTNSFIHARKLQ